MKRFIECVLLLLLLGIGAYWATFYGGYYIPRSEETEISVPFRAQDSRLWRLEGQDYAELRLRGVDISASMPGHYATQYDAQEEDYLRWFEAIGDMGANTLRASSLMNDDFYNALCAYNESHEQPLYLLQGIGLSDEVGNGDKSAYDRAFIGSLLSDGKALVDIIHGRKNLPAEGIRSGGIYRQDISQWVVGLLVGTEWYADTISYTDHSAVRSEAYSGRYFRTAGEASAFEAAMAQVMDGITAYETEKYGQQRPIGFICDPQCDFLEYEEVYARQLQKHARLDPEHVLPSEKLAAGYFAAYRLYDFCDDFTRYLSARQKEALAPLLAGLDIAQPYGGYLALLAKYHSMPLVAAGYSFSSARGTVAEDQPPLTEREQGQCLAEVSRALEADGWAGGFISTWQDEWERRSWNTAFATLPTENYRWHDLQTVSQSSGLMAFAPGTEPVCTVDGDASEWSEEDVLLEREGLRLSASYDAEGLYLLLEGVDRDTPAYVPVDISPELGSLSCSAPALAFRRQAELLLCIDGEENTRLLVQERCSALRERFLYETEGLDPFVDYPAMDSARFVPVGMAVENRQLLDSLDAESLALQRLGTWETGRLVHGKGDSTAADYNSLADFCFGEGLVELRIPWLLLNVGDPSAMRVHRDYYSYYGVEFKQIKELWLGAALSEQPGEIPMAAMAVKGWSSVEYRERLKDSYYIMKQLWKGQTEDGAIIR